MVPLLALAMQATALPPQAHVAITPVCRVVVIDSGATGETLAASCGGTGVLLGRDTRHQLATHAQTGAVAVMLEGPMTTRVLVISPGSDGRPLVQDVTADLAKAVGRSRDGQLAAAEINLGRFTAEGLVVARGSRPTDTSAGGQFSIVDSLAEETARKALPVVAPPLVAVVPTGHGPEVVSAQAGR